MPDEKVHEDYDDLIFIAWHYLSINEDDEYICDETLDLSDDEEPDDLDFYKNVLPSCQWIGYDDDEYLVNKF